MNAIFNDVLFPPLGATLVHYNLSPINTTNCVSTMNHYNYNPIREGTDSVSTESSTTLEADRSENLFLPLLHEDDIVAPSGATMALSDQLLFPVNHGLPTVALSDLLLSPTNHGLPTVVSSDSCEQ